MVDGVVWMEDNERTLVQNAATRASGVVLEVGFGLGYAHRALHDNPSVVAIVVVEKYQQVLDRYKTCACKEVVSDWLDLGDQTWEFDTLYFDATNGVTKPEDVEPLLRYIRPGGRVILYNFDGAEGWFDIYRVGPPLVFMKKVTG
jgi:hypothetical protein